LPDGQISGAIYRSSCPAPFAKIFPFAPDPNQQYIVHRPVPQRGARAIVTNAERDAVDADSAGDDRRFRLRQSFGGLALEARRSLWRRRVRWTAKSCGPHAPTLESSWRSNSPTTVAKEPGHRGRARRKPLKPLRAGMPGESGATVVTTLVCFVSSFAREAAGASSARHSPRPLWAKGLGKARAHRAARSRTRIGICRHCEERLVRRSSSSEGGSDEAIHFTMPRHGLLRGACHRARIRATRWLAMTVSRPHVPWLFEN
jgi:hypothetical protein